MALRVVVVQHGDKERLPGDPGLTEAGKRQALATARWLAGEDTPVATLFSPMRRARETTTPITEAFAVAPTTDPRLRERMNWEDPLAESVEDFLEDWRAASADRAYVPRNGDSSAEAASRFLAALDDLAITHPLGTAIVLHMEASQPTHSAPCSEITNSVRGHQTLSTTECPAARSRHFM